jgi:hypothetical protein
MTVVIQARQKMKNRDGYLDMDNNICRIVNADPATIPKYIKNSNYGDHSLVLYPHVEQFEEFYIECCKDSLLQRNEVFVLLTYYQHVSAVRKKMNMLADINAGAYENDGTLIILDSEMAYKPCLEQNGRYNVIILTNLLMKNAQEHGKKGITLVSDMGTFFLTNRIPDLISHELSHPNRIDADIRSFCCYHEADFNVLDEEQRKRILQHHLNDLIIV